MVLLNVLQLQKQSDKLFHVVVHYGNIFVNY